MHFRTMSSGLSHPLAARPGIFTYDEDYVDLRHVSYSLQVSGTYLGCLMSSVDEWPNGRHELIVLNWRTGDIVMVSILVSFAR